MWLLKSCSFGSKWNFLTLLRGFSEGGLSKGKGSFILGSDNVKFFSKMPNPGRSFRFPFWSGHLWFWPVKHAFRLGPSCFTLPALSPSDYRRTNPTLQILGGTCLWSVSEGTASLLARVSGSREGKWPKPDFPRHRNSISKLLLELMDNSHFFQIRVWLSRQDINWVPEGENLVRICLSIIQQQGKLCWEVKKSWFLTTCEHLEVVMPEDSLLELLRCTSSISPLLFHLDRVGFVSKRVLTNPPSIKAEKPCLRYFFQIEEWIVTQLTMKWWPVENLSLLCSKMVPMAVATGGQEDLVSESCRKEHKGALYG